MQNETMLATMLGGEAVGTYNPGLGSLVEMVGHAAHAAELKAAAGTTGEQKRMS